jgi:hypothetical protein
MAGIERGLLPQTALSRRSRIAARRNGATVAPRIRKDSPMSLSLYQASVPVYEKLLNALSGVLDKAAAHAKETKYEPAALLGAHLFPDMWPFAKQVQAVASHARRGTARLAGLPIPNVNESAASFDDLKGQIAETLAFLKSVDAAAVDAGEEREISFPVGPTTLNMKGTEYLLNFTLPNFYFHLTTAYDILRKNGVPLGKRDFLGWK